MIDASVPSTATEAHVMSDAIVVPLGEAPKYGKTDIEPAEAAAAPTVVPSITLDLVRADPEVQAFIRQANKNLGVLGFTEHGFRHVGLVATSHEMCFAS